MASSSSNSVALPLTILLLFVAASTTTPTHALSAEYSRDSPQKGTSVSDHLILEYETQYDPPPLLGRSLGQNLRSDSELKTSSALAVYRNHVHDEIQSSKRNHRVADRALRSNLVAFGYTIIWTSVDIIFGSILSVHYQNADLYRNISRDAGEIWLSRLPTQCLIFAYGAFQLSFTSASPILWRWVQDIRMILSLLSVFVLFGMFRIIVLIAYTTIVVTLSLLENNHRSVHLVSGPLA